MSSYLMLGAAQAAAPDAEAQMALASLRRTMQKHNEPDNQITLALAEAVADGLRHGNWLDKAGVIEPGTEK